MYHTTCIWLDIKLTLLCYRWEVYVHQELCASYLDLWIYPPFVLGRVSHQQTLLQHWLVSSHRLCTETWNLCGEWWYGLCKILWGVLRTCLDPVKSKRNKTQHHSSNFNGNNVEKTTTFIHVCIFICRLETLTVKTTRLPLVLEWSYKPVLYMYAWTCLPTPPSWFKLLYCWHCKQKR